VVHLCLQQAPRLAQLLQLMTAVFKSAQLYLLVGTALQEVKGLLHSDQQSAICVLAARQ